jgi:alpha-tubulin suppressor-like RCC1 family protein
MSSTPTTVLGLAGAVSLAAGEGHTCAVISDGTARCWGWNLYGQLGDGGEVSSLTPIPVPGLSGVASLVAGAAHTCALLNDGSVTCWGWNGHGQAGNTNGNFTRSPAPIAGFAGVRELAAGFAFNCARMDDGAARCWGLNELGQLGDGTTVETAIPTAVSGLTGVASISAGWSHACARLADQSVKCWGYNRYGQLGNGTSLDSPVAVAVSGLSGVASLDAGYFHTCAALSGGQARCWGGNFYGQLGDGTLVDAAVPVGVAGVESVASLVGGWSHTCAVLPDRSAKCWGLNGEGELGNGTLQDASLPTTVAGFASLGGLCSGAADCASGICVDAVCCASACPAGAPGCTPEPVPACVAPACSDTPIEIAEGIDTVGGLEVTFNGDVTSPGTIAAVSSGAGNPPGPLPTGYRILSGSTGLYYWDIDTTASYTPPIEVCVRHDPGARSECVFRLVHDDGGGFLNITTTSCDRTGLLCGSRQPCATPNVICGTATSLSPFAIVEPIDTDAPVLTDVPGTIVAYATSTAGALVRYAPPTASDAVDGARPVACSPGSGSTFSPGKTSIACTASDVAGNAATATFTVWVQYQAPADAGFFLRPIRGDGSSRFKIGRAVPVKFRLEGASAGITDLVARLTVARISEVVRGTTDCEGDEDGEDDDGVFRYRKPKGLYGYRWKTRGEAPGTYRLSADLGDGVAHEVLVSLRALRP